MESRRGEEGLALLLAVVASLGPPLSFSLETRVMKTQRDKASSNNSLSTLLPRSRPTSSPASPLPLLAARHQIGSLWRGGMRERPIGIGGVAPTAPKEGFFLEKRGAFSLSLSLPASRRPDDDDNEGSQQSSPAPGPLQAFSRSFLAAEASATSLWDSPGSEKTARDASTTGLKERHEEVDGKNRHTK